jgi:hypothetical protein
VFLIGPAKFIFYGEIQIWFFYQNMKTY